MGATLGEEASSIAMLFFLFNVEIFANGNSRSLKDEDDGASAAQSL